MTDYKCPYCGQDSYTKKSKNQGKFLSWKAIKAHVVNCSLNTQTYIICEFKGPISYNDCLQVIKDFHKKNGRIPQARELEEKSYYGICRRTITKKFGSWNSLVKAAGFTPNIQNGFGVDTYAKDGKLYRSSHEAYFVNTFLYGKYEYQYELPYGNGWYYDFYIKELDLYVELDGGLRPERIQEKLKYHLANSVNCRIIKTQDIYKKEFKLNVILDT